MNKTFKQITTALLCALYFAGNGVLGYAQESNIWADRRKSIEKDSPLVIAGLPTLPSLTSMTAITPSETSPHFQSTGIESLFKDVPLHLMSLQSAQKGASSEEPVLIIQDIHLNYEAQSNIAGFLESLLQNKKIAAVGAEGAFGAFDFSVARNFPDKKITRLVADVFLKNNFMGAPSYAGVTIQKELPAFIGVDDKALYNSNVDAYLRSRKSIKTITRRLEKIKTAQSKEALTLSPSARELALLEDQYHSDTIPFGQFVEKLTEIQSTDDLLIAQFLEAYKIEKQLNFKAVDQDRRVVLEKLTASLSKEEVNDLFLKSVAYKEGRLGFGPFYKHIKDLCRTKGISLKNHPLFETYLKYVLLSDQLNAPLLLEKVAALEEAAINNKNFDENDHSFLVSSNQRRMTQKLIRFELTPAEWANYNANPKLKDLSSSELEPFESFYRLADQRSERMMETLLAQKGKGLRVLVTGGFHAPEISALLAAKKISYAIVSPKITHLDSSSGSDYLSIFERDKGSLDMMFKGEKLFLSPRGEFPAEQFKAALKTAASHGPASLAEKRLIEKKIDKDNPFVYGMMTYVFMPFIESVFYIAPFIILYNGNSLGMVLLAAAALLPSSWIHARLHSRPKKYSNGTGSSYKQVRYSFGLTTLQTRLFLGSIMIGAAIFIPDILRLIDVDVDRAIPVPGMAEIYAALISFGAHSLYNVLAKARRKPPLSLLDFSFKSSSERAFIETDYFENLVFKETDIPADAEIEVFSLMDSSHGNGAAPTPLKQLNRAEILDTEEHGRVVNVTVGQMAIVKEGIILSQGHMNCISGDMQLMKDGKIYRAHFHIYPTKLNGFTESQYFFHQIQRIYSHLERSGFTEGQLVINLDPTQSGFNLDPNEIQAKLKTMDDQMKININLYPIQHHDENTQTTTFNTDAMVLARQQPITLETTEKPELKMTAWLPLGSTPRQVAYEWLKQFAPDLSDINKQEIDEFIGNLLASSHYSNSFVGQVHSIIIQNIFTESTLAAAKITEESHKREPYAVYLTGDFVRGDGNFTAPIDFVIFPGNNSAESKRFSALLEKNIKAEILNRGFNALPENNSVQEPLETTLLKSNDNGHKVPYQYLDLHPIYGAQSLINQIESFRHNFSGGNKIVFERAVNLKSFLNAMEYAPINSLAEKVYSAPAFFIRPLQSFAAILRVDNNMAFAANINELFERLGHAGVMSEPDATKLREFYEELVALQYRDSHFKDPKFAGLMAATFVNEIVPIFKQQLARIDKKKAQETQKAKPQELAKKFNDIMSETHDTCLVTFHMILNILSYNKVYGNRTPDEILAEWQDKNILDVGAGPMTLVRTLEKELGYTNMHAIDPIMRNPTDRFRKGSVEDMPLDWKGKFDVIFSFFMFNPEVTDGTLYKVGIDVEKAANSLKDVSRNGGNDGLLIIATGPMGMGESLLRDEQYITGPTIRSRDFLVQKFGEPLYESNGLYIFKNDLNRMRKANLQTMAGDFLIDTLRKPQFNPQIEKQIDWILSYVKAESLDLNKIGRNKLTLEEADKLSSLFERSLDQGLRSEKIKRRDLFLLWTNFSTMLRNHMDGAEKTTYAGPVHGALVTTFEPSSRQVFVSLINSTDKNIAIGEMQALIHDLQRTHEQSEKVVYVVAPKAWHSDLDFEAHRTRFGSKIVFLDPSELPTLSKLQDLESKFWESSTYHILAIGENELPEGFIDLGANEMDSGRFHFYAVRFLQDTLRLIALETSSDNLHNMLRTRELAGQSA